IFYSSLSRYFHGRFLVFRSRRLLDHQIARSFLVGFKKRARVATGPAGVVLCLVLQTINIQLTLRLSGAQCVMRSGDENLSVGHDGLSKLNAEAWRVRGVLRT